MVGNVLALQHKTSKRYLVVMQGRTASAEYIAYTETPNEEEATTWDREGAEQAHMALGSFAGCWKITELDRPVSLTEEI